jgi:hypothetical protein
MRRVVLGAPLALLFLLGCSNDSTKPHENPSSPPLSEATIGPGGGVLETEDFSLSVPEGAFREEVDLRLYLMEEGLPGIETSSRAFRVEGLPVSFAAPLEVRLGISGEREGTPLVLVGEKTFVKSGGEVLLAWRPQEAREEEGFLVASLEPPPDGKSARGSDLMDLALGAAYHWQTLTTQQGHFRISYPSTVHQTAADLGTYLEEAYTKFLDLGFEYDKRTRWPIWVSIEHMSDTVFGEAVASMWGHNYAWMRFNWDKVDDEAALRVTAGHEFFHLVQDFYDPRSAWARSRSASRHYWLDEATAVWSEELFSDDPDYVPDVRNGLVLEPFQGVQGGAVDGQQSHGYGMSAVVKHLAKERGPTVVKSIYDAIAGGDHPAKALERAAGGPYAEWLNDFFVQYFTGRIYGTLEVQFMVQGRLEEWKVLSEEDTLREFRRYPPALAAMTYKVVLGNPGLDDDASAEFTVDGTRPRKLNVFSYAYTSDTGDPTLIATDSDRIVIPHIKTIMEGRKFLVLILVNEDDDAPDYIATADHTVTVRILPGAPVLDALKRTERLSYSALVAGGLHYFRYTDPDTQYVFSAYEFPGLPESVPGDAFGGPWPPLSFEGTRFYAEGTVDVWEWSIEGSLSADGKRLVSLTATIATPSALGGSGASGEQGFLSITMRDLDLSALYRIEEESCYLPYSGMSESNVGEIAYYRQSGGRRANGRSYTQTWEYLYTEWQVPFVSFSFQQAAP